MRKVYHRIQQITGSVISVNAGGVSYRELAVVSTDWGPATAQVIRIEGDRVSLIVFSGTRGISTNSEVRFLGHRAETSFSPSLLGRVFNGSGVPRDGGPDLKENMVEIQGPTVNPAKRIIPKNMIRTGIPMIDIFNTLVESQKLPIFSVPGEPYNALLARIAMNAEVDIVILGGMGLKYDDYLYFRDTFEERGILSRSILYVHTAADPSVECLLVPDTCLAVGEKFALEGKRVLVLLTDMTNYADSLKEIAITMEQIPGSLTVLGVTTMPGDDVTHPVPDNTGYITEGQFYLRNGRIEPFGSLSRLKQQVNGDTRDDHRAIMNTMVQLYASARESMEKQAMGFRMSAWDDKLLKYADRFEKEMMSLEVSIPLEKALDLGWEILSDCFSKSETGISSKLVDKYWPGNGK
jgi:V/A-type H+-transporting ATPase subunit B